MFTFLAFVNSIEEGHICRPPSDGEVLFLFFLMIFLAIENEPFLEQPKRTKVKGRELMGELLLGGQRGREVEKKIGASCLVQRRQLRRDETQLYENVGQLSEKVAVIKSFWGVMIKDR